MLTIKNSFDDDSVLVVGNMLVRKGIIMTLGELQQLHSNFQSIQKNFIHSAHIERANHLNEKHVQLMDMLNANPKLWGKFENLNACLKHKNPLVRKCAKLQLVQGE